MFRGAFGGGLESGSVRQKGGYDDNDGQPRRIARACGVPGRERLRDQPVPRPRSKPCRRPPATRRRGCTRCSTGRRSRTARRGPTCAHEVRSGLKADFERLEAVLRRRVRPGRRARSRRVRRRPGQRLERARAAGAGARHGARRRRLPAGSARAVARARTRRARRCRRPRARDACSRFGTDAWSRLRTGRRRRRASTIRAAGRRPGSSATSRISRRSTTGPWPRSWKRGSAGSAGRASWSCAATRPAPSSRRRSRRRSPMR